MVTVQSTTFSRELWLSNALEVLACEGSAGLSLNNLIGKFHVTKGSFYWHFKNQQDFHRALIDYWHESHTVRVANTIDNVTGGPARQLASLMEMVMREELSKKDALISMLAARNPELVPAVRSSFAFRFRYVRKLLSAARFRGKSLDARTHIFVAHAMAEPTINSGLSVEERVAMIPATLAVITAGKGVEAP